MKKAIAVLLTLSIMPIATAGEFERILIPIRNRTPIPGAHGSLWASSLLVTNTASDEVRLHGVAVDCGISCPPTAVIGGGETFRLDPIGNVDRPGAIVQVVESDASKLSFSSRVQDLSRQSQTWGTEVPVVRESDLRTDAVRLVGIPDGEAFRAWLRIYDVSQSNPAVVRVRIFGVRPGEPLGPVEADEFLGEAFITLRQPPDGDSGRSPSYVEMGGFTGIVSPHEYDLLSIEIVPETPGLFLWAFVAIVNNETQHLTLVTPQ